MISAKSVMIVAAAVAYDARHRAWVRMTTGAGDHPYPRVIPSISQKKRRLRARRAA